MGIMMSTAEFLVDTARSGIAFGNTLTLGRQNMFVSPIKLARLLKKGGLWPAGYSDKAFYQAVYGSPFYAEPFFRFLGATDIVALDNSRYEGASVIHDLNLPIPDTLKEKYDTVCDIGALEHVFNFPAALLNCMEMVRVGGHLIVVTPANNYHGHGFYQFSSEVFYRTLSSERGFEVRRMLACENENFDAKILGQGIPVELRGNWHEVLDSATLGRRTCLTTRYPVQLFVLAQKVRSVTATTTPPQQSDYAATWDSFNVSHEQREPERLSFSRYWPLVKEIQLSWLPLFCRALTPPFFWRKARLRSFHRRNSGFKDVGSSLLNEKR
jgi:hypothetical protein